MKHYKSVEFLSIFRMSSPSTQTRNPPMENFPATVLYTDTELQDFKLMHKQNNKLRSLNYTKRFMKDIFLQS